MTEDIEPQEDNESGEGLVDPRRWSWYWMAGCLVNAIGNTARVVMSVADETALAIARHDQFCRSQADFADSVRLDLESLAAVPQPADQSNR